MILGIDASNIRIGGGVTHLVELLRAADPQAQGFSHVIVWSGRATLDRIEERQWLAKRRESLLDRSLPYRTLWQRFRLSTLARMAGCDVLFVPGGFYAGDFHPVVTMSRNLLPFDGRELRRFGFSWMSIKLGILRIAQTRTFRRADRLIFLTQYAREVVMRVVGNGDRETRIVPHGVDKRFVFPPRKQLPISRFSADRPFRLLYVSTIDMFKHQWHVAEAVAQLRGRNLPVVLNLVGPGYPRALKRLRRSLDRIDPTGSFLHYAGSVPYAELPARYAEADLFLFASSCENMPNILLEGMASGLPIVCSNRGPMPEILGDAGVYFDPEDPSDISRILRKMIEAPELRARMATASFERSRLYSWTRCARETFDILAKAAKAPGSRILAMPL